MEFASGKLYDEFRKLSQNSIKSVQSGRKLSTLDSYLHVERHIEKVLQEKMDEIERIGGGIVLLIGSAGDGKSHLLSKVRENYNWNDASFYNDATASCSPYKTAVETLKEALVDFSDSSIDTTSRKLVLAINLGKLNAFIEDEEVKNKYKKIIKATEGIFDDDDSTIEKETEKIKIVLFTNEQIFEICPQESVPYPISSNFLSLILQKIVAETDSNPFYVAYQEDKRNSELNNSPILHNYEILRCEKVRDTIVNIIIEAIVRFNLIITPREFLDFVYSIVVVNQINYSSKKEDYYKALLPSLIFSGGENQILKAIAKIDPLVSSNVNHDKILSDIFTSNSIPISMKNHLEDAKIPQILLEKINLSYQDNGRNLELVMQFLFRLYHLIDYHSESEVYKNFLLVLSSILKNDQCTMIKMYDLVNRVLPRHYGSYFASKGFIPINVQGGQYKLFTELEYSPLPTVTNYDPSCPSSFPLYFILKWEIKNENEPLPLKVDYQLYSYLYDLDKGRLITKFNQEQNIAFKTYVRKLSNKSNQQQIKIVKFDNTSKILERIWGRTVRYQ